MLPWDGEVPLLLVLWRGLTPELCTVTVVNPSQRGCEFHACDGQAPPKLKFRTCLELGEVPLAKLADEAWWVVLWFGMSINPSDAQAAASAARSRSCTRCCCLDGRLLDRAVARWGAKAAESGLDPTPPRTPRRSRAATTAAAATRCATCCSVRASARRSAATRRCCCGCRCSVSRSTTSSSCSTSTAPSAPSSASRAAAAHKAAKLGEQRVISLERMGAVRREFGGDEALKAVAGLPDQTAPPPLVLCAADAHLGRPSLEALPGERATARGCCRRPAAPRSPAEILEGVEVLGFYFSASWCPPCVGTTPLLVQAYNTLRQRGHGIELLLVPQDKEEDAFDEYRMLMPWRRSPSAATCPQS